MSKSLYFLPKAHTTGVGDSLHQAVTSLIHLSSSGLIPIFSATKRKITVKHGQKLKEVTHIVPANTTGQFWAIKIVYQLLNNTSLASLESAGCVSFPGQTHNH